MRALIFNLVMIKVREAREEDRKSAVRVMWKAFEAQRNYADVEKEEWIERWNHPENEDWAYIAVDGDKVVANLSFFASKEDNNIIRGVPLRFGGVWAVATDPAYRNRGLIRELFKVSFQRMREEKIYLSILDPFKRSYYEQFDYALGEKRARHIFAKEQLRTGITRDDITYRELSVNDNDVQKAIEVEKSMTRFGSRFWCSKDYLTSTIKRGHFFLFETDNEPVGTVAFHFAERHPIYNLTVGNTRYKYDEVFPSIVELVSNHAVNTAKVTWYTDYQTPVRHYISDYSMTESQIYGSMMMRVIDFIDYCHHVSIPREVTERVILKLEDQFCSWNSGTYSLIPNDGQLEVERVDQEPDLRVNAFQLSKIIGGVSPPIMLRSLNEIECTSETAKNLEAIFPKDYFVSYIRF
ncbi:GNAT family N-acetyltransferase [Candidatus Thorarchaeota archaeon]|nr:MAG: GNAT family N-acetyltransferase [Candidatus Thorarchaeota archaeon]